ncbi:MAG: HAMP domain-containing histidine kinase [Clostridia bacterium]|nr:HAMP domain-containing histidine kinase [Clostridia bacterium]
MKLWQKNYLLTALLFTSVLFVCAAVLLALTGRNTMQRLTESAVSEEKAIAGALDSMVLHEDERIDAVLRGIANQYKQSGVYLRLVNGGTVYVDLLPYPPMVQTGELRWEAEAGRICISIGEAFPEGFTMTYCKDVTAQAQTAQRGLLLAAGLCFLLSAGVNAVLYAMMLRVNLPLSRLSHELRTPVTVVRGYGELLKIAVLTDEQRYNAASYIVEECDRMQAIIQRLLILHDRERIEKTRIRMSALRERLSMAWPGIVIETEGDALYGDPTLLYSLLDNLIGNAVKAGGTVTVRLSPKMLSVTDTGSGMDETMLAYVNDPAHTERPSGIQSGLGVPLCHEIAALHGGLLRYTSASGQGTTATVTIYNSDTTL